MPELSRFYGIIVECSTAIMHHRISTRLTRGEEVQIDINTLRVIEGKIRQRALELVLGWAQLYQQELRGAWTAASHNEQPHKIAPSE